MPFPNGCYESSEEDEKEEKKPGIMNPGIRLEFSKDWIKNANFSEIEESYRRIGISFSGHAISTLAYPKPGELWRVTYKTGHYINGKLMDDTDYLIVVTIFGRNNIIGSLAKPIDGYGIGSSLSFHLNQVLSMERVNAVP